MNIDQTVNEKLVIGVADNQNTILQLINHHMKPKPIVIQDQGVIAPKVVNKPKEPIKY